MPREKYKKNKESSRFTVKRGDIFYADLGTEEDSVGSEQYGIRPVVITQCNKHNDHSTTYIIAIITSELKKEYMDTHVVLPPVKGLPLRSMVCCEQRFTIDHQRLISYRGHLNKKNMKKVTRACRKAEAGDKEHRPRSWRAKRDKPAEKGR